MGARELCRGLALLGQLCCAVWLAAVAKAEPSGGPQTLTAPTEGESNAVEWEAKRSFEAGRAAFEVGQFEQARAHFERAYTLSGRPELLFNIGLAHDRLREDEEALVAFERYLAEAQDPIHRVQVERRVAALRAARRRREARANPPMAPTPQQVARKSRPAPAAPEPAVVVTPAQVDDGGLFTKWWFWTAVAAVVVAGGATATYLVVQPDELPEPNTGRTVLTLTEAPR